MIMGGRTTPPMPKMPPPIPPPAEVDRPEIAHAEMDMAAPKQEATTGKKRKYRVKAKGSGTSKSHSKYKGGGLAGYTQKKAGNK